MRKRLIPLVSRLGLAPTWLLDVILNLKESSAKARAENAIIDRRHEDRAKFNYQLAKHPEWTPEGLRDMLRREVEAALGHEHADRLDNVYVDPVIVDPLRMTPERIAEIAHGGEFRVRIMLKSAARLTRGAATTFTVPRLMPMSAIARMLPELRLSMKNAVKGLEKFERLMVEKIPAGWEPPEA